MLGNDAAGLYVLGHRALDIMILLPSLFGFALFPAMARYGMESPQAAARLGERALRFMLAAVVPLTLLLTFTAAPIIGFFDQAGEFPDSVTVLMIVIWALPLQAANTIFGRLLITADREKAFVTIGLVAMLANVALNAVWIPRHGYYGASWATIISVAVSTGMHLFWLQPSPYRLPLVRALAGPVAATAAAWAAAVGLLRLVAPGWGASLTGLPLQGWGPFLGAVGLTVVLYAAALAVLRVIRSADLELLRELAPGRPRPPA
jgi:O-antigen/teichoic acid export membrane protein